jgi:hypothetical protein
MINPLWLENAFIIINTGIDYEEQISVEKTIRDSETDIIALKGLSINKVVNLYFAAANFVAVAQSCSSSHRGTSDERG